MFKSLCFYLVFLLLLGLANTAQACKIKRAYEALSVYNYFKAKELFEKKWETNKASASFGLSVIYGRNDNPFYNLDSAHMHIALAASNFSALQEKDKLRIEAFGVDSAGIENWKDTIDLKSFRHTIKINTIEELERYMLAHFDSDFIIRAEQLRDSIVYQSVMRKGTSKAFHSFIEKYPSSHLKTEAFSQYESLLFQELRTKGDLRSYRNFVQLYPRHPQRMAVEDSIFVLSIQQKSIKEYRDFIQRNPTNKNVNKSWRSIYKLFTAKYSPEIIQDFKEQFPDYPFKEDLQQDFNLASELFLPFKAAGFWGFMDKYGEIKISPQYTIVESFSEGLALVGLGDKFGFINKMGDVVVPFEFDEAYSFKNGIAVVSKNEYFGVVNRINKVVAPFKYDFIEPFHDAIALAASESGYGFVSSTGQELTSFDFSYATDFSNGYALVSKGNRMAVLDTSFRVVVPFNYSKLFMPKDSIIIAKGDSLYGLINLNGDTILDFKYDRIDDFTEGLALIQKSDKYGYVNDDGEISIPIIYSYSFPASIWGQFNKGYAKFQRNGKFGVLSITGEEVSPSIFENIKDYNLSELFPVKKKDKWGFANDELQLKIKYIYTMAESFYLGSAIVKNDTAFGLIDESAKWLIQPQYQSIKRMSDSIFLVQQGKLGVLNARGGIILSLEYDEIQVIDKGLLKLKKENNVFYYHLKENRFVVAKE